MPFAIVFFSLKKYFSIKWKDVSLPLECEINFSNFQDLNLRYHGLDHETAIIAEIWLKFSWQ